MELQPIHDVELGCGLSDRRSATVGVVGCLLVGGLLIGCDSEDRSGGEPGQASPGAAVEAPKAGATHLPEPDESPPSPPSARGPEAEPAKSAPPGEPGAPVAEPEAAPAEPPTLDDVLARHSETLSAVRGVVGVESAECDGAPCIRITVARRTQQILSNLPTSVEGYPVTVVERRGSH